MKWSRKDEQRMAELQAQLEALADRRVKAVGAVREAIQPFVQSNTNPSLHNWLIENADAIRDVLEPFDSGVRPATEPDFSAAPEQEEVDATGFRTWTPPSPGENLASKVPAFAYVDVRLADGSVVKQVETINCRWTPGTSVVAWRPAQTWIDRRRNVLCVPGRDGFGLPTVGWHAWNGGADDPPGLTGDQYVEYVLRGQRLVRPAMRVRELNWQQNENGTDIVAYREIVDTK